MLSFCQGSVELLENVSSSFAQLGLSGAKMKATKKLNSEKVTLLITSIP